MKTASQPNPAVQAALSTAVLLFLLLFVLLSYTFSHEGGQASVNPTLLALKAGTYQIRYSFPKTSGRIRLYSKIK